MERVINDMRKFALDYYQKQPLKYHLEKYLVFKLASLGGALPSRIGASLLSSPLGRPIGKILHRNFCGGEDLEEAILCAENYRKSKIGTMLDLVREPGTDESNFTSDINKCLPIIRDISYIMYSVKFSALFGPENLAAASAKLAKGASFEQFISTSIMAETFDRILNRLEVVKNNCSYKVTIDAEWSDIQPAISAIALELMQRLNTESAFLFNTYQAYLRGTEDLFKRHVETSKLQNFSIGAKVVRGAYLTYEMQNHTHLVFDSIESTHQSYDNIIRFAMEQKLPPESILVASHNEQSIAKAVVMKDSMDDRSIMFAQLHGMRDFITYFLADRDIPVYKYVPYGTLSEALPYLIRRAEENSGFLETLKYEKHLISSQLFKKLMC